jgi:hypothetical protein
MGQVSYLPHLSAVGRLETFLTGMCGERVRCSPLRLTQMLPGASRRYELFFLESPPAPLPSTRNI